MTTVESGGGRAAVLTLRGDVDFFSEDDFRAEAERLLALPELSRLIVDLEQVDVVDSSGLGLIVDLLRLCRDLGLEMTLRSVPERVLRLLDLTGLDQVITVE